ncbi:MAG TPA: O-antigen ligase family protein [Promineifilum sp.]|nr:O-antigen ligase family protein [Promineifilum sp.]
MDKPLANRLESRAVFLRTSAVDVVVLALTAPFLLAAGWAPRSLSLAALALLAVPFVVRRGRTGRFARPMALNWPVTVLGLVFLPAAMLLSPAPWAVSWPRAATLAWSIVLFYAVANWPARPRVHRHGRQATRLSGPTWGFLALGGVVAVLAPLVMRSVDKLFFLPQTGWLATRLGWQHALPTNEVAGVLTLFIPFTVALAAAAWWTQRRRLLAALAPLTLLLLAALALTQSRTGLMASAVGALLALLLGARPRRKTLVIGLGAVALILAAVALSPLREWFVFAGANSWQSVIGPRLGIWGQALDGIRDHPVWGMGLGAFGLLARLIYPLVPVAQSAVIEDAHNLYLQTTLDFGILGGLLLLLLLGVAVWSGWGLARARPPRALSRLWAAGLVGALVAHALYSLTDAVALGALGGVALWYVFGLIMSSTTTRTERAVEPFQRWSPLVIGVAGLMLLSALMMTARPVNRAGQLAGAVALNTSQSAATAAATAGPLTAARCRAGWYEGLLWHAAGDMARRSAVWAELLACATDYTGYMAVLAGDDAALARRAVDVQPDNPAGYFWLAALSAPDEAIGLYRQGLALAPGDGRRWLALAELLDGRDEDAALDAYLQACLHGDPGANGCARAAAIVAARGDLETAIRYYRLSNWSEARAMADELERQLDP